MTLPLSRPLAATPHQRNRRLLLTLPACALPVLSACGGGADLGYDTEQALYVVGEAITPNNPQLTTSNPDTAGHTAPTFSVWPALPAGLALHPKTGVISGTPTQLRRQGTHTVIARNNRGFAETQVRITVTGRGAWSPVASIALPRHSACIAPLPGGKVLVVGGITANGWTDKAEIFDPATSSWSPAASMMLNREEPMCMALRDGRVLVFGGGHGGNTVQLTELYDPVANQWSATGSMVVPRSDAASCLLPDGRVLVSGGLSVSEDLVAVELYDPGTGIWTAMPHPMVDPRAKHAAVLLPDGKTVLMVGGNRLPSGQNRSELYALDGRASKFVPSSIRGVGTQAVQLDDGSVLIVTDANTSWRYYPRTSSWKTSALAGARLLSRMILLADGRVLRAGGLVLGAEIYNPDVNIWTTAAPLAQARRNAAAALLPNGNVLMVSGTTSALVDSSELYTP